MKRTVRMTLQVKVAWWLWAYLAGVRFLSEVTGMEPDWSKVDAVIAKGVKAVVR